MLLYFAIAPITKSDRPATEKEFLFHLNKPVHLWYFCQVDFFKTQDWTKLIVIYYSSSTLKWIIDLVYTKNVDSQHQIPIVLFSSKTREKPCMKTRKMPGGKEQILSWLWVANQSAENTIHWFGNIYCLIWVIPFSCVVFLDFGQKPHTDGAALPRSWWTDCFKPNFVFWVVCETTQNTIS